MRSKLPVVSQSQYVALWTYHDAGNKERYGGTEFSLTDLVEKSKVEIVVVRLVFWLVRETV